MASVVDTLVTRYIGDSSSHEAAVRRINAANNDLTANIEGKLPKVQEAAMNVARAFGAATAAILTLSGVSFRQFANFDALTKSLQAIEGSAGKAGEALKVLKDIAKLPGLGLEEAIGGFSGLRMQGLNSAQSERILRATGNANAVMGGGRDELARVLLAIQQQLSRPYLDGEIINRLGEARLPARKALVNAFGTGDTEELTRRGITSAMALEAIISELEKMPKAADSSKNFLENMQVAFGQVMTQIGAGLAVYLLPHLQAFGAALDRLIQAEAFSVLGDALANWWSSFEGLTNGVTTWEGAIIAVTGAIAGAIDALANINRVLITIAKNPLVQLAIASLNPVGNIGAIVAGGLSGFFESSIDRTKQMAQKVRDSERYGGGAISSFLGQGMDASLEGFTLGGDNTRAAEAADTINRKATAHLAAIESNTRQMVDLQRHILGGGNIGAMGVTPVELADMRAGGSRGSGEEMVLAGVRRMVMEMQGPMRARRGF